MKKFVYPAVLFYDNNEKQYTIAMYDIDVYAEAKTVEEAVAAAQDFLNEYLETAFSYNIEIPEPTDFEIMIDMFPQNMVLLVESKLNDKNKAV